MRTALKASAGTFTGALRSREGGFTLIELLIALAISAIVLLVITQTYFTALKLYNASDRRETTDLTLDRALQLIEDDVAGLRLPADSMSSSGAVTPATPPAGTFAGQFQDTPTDSITQEFNDTRISPDFYTTDGVIDGWTQFSEGQVVAYFLAPANDGSNTKSLVRAVTRNLLPVNTPETDEQTLVTGVQDAEFEYYDGTEWTTTWDSTVTATLPQAIEFSLTMAPSGPNMAAPQPVELVMPVLVSTKTTLQQNQQASQSSTGGTGT